MNIARPNSGFSLPLVAAANYVLIFAAFSGHAEEPPPLDPAAIEDLAVWCDRRGLAQEAAKTRAWKVAEDPEKLTVALVPSQAAWEPPAEEETPSQDVDEWRRRFQALRIRRGAAWLKQAKRAIAEGDRPKASQLLHRVLREDPSQQQAREWLGYQLKDDRWYTPFELKRVLENETWHPRFGWVPKKDVGRLENGERFYQQQWISAETEKKRRARSGWNVSTEHFTVWTNISQEAGAELGWKLEQLYQAWRQIFFEFAAGPKELAAAQAPIAPPAAPRRFRINYYRERDEYLAALRKREPNIGVSSGYYSPSARTAWFFAPDDNDWSTLFHETTHQLFQESRRVDRDAGVNGGACALEAIACYMESLEIANDLATVGGTDATRFANARTLLIDEMSYTPLAELTRLGRVQLQSHPQIRNLYTQSAGMAQFFMHAERGGYRDGFLAYLTDIYADKADPATLAKRTGKSYPELDAAYRRYVERAP